MEKINLILISQHTQMTTGVFLRITNIMERLILKSSLNTIELVSEEDQVDLIFFGTISRQ